MVKHKIVRLPSVSFSFPPYMRDIVPFESRRGDELIDEARRRVGS